MGTDVKTYTTSDGSTITFQRIGNKIDAVTSTGQHYLIDAPPLAGGAALALGIIGGALVDGAGGALIGGAAALAYDALMLRHMLEQFAVQSQ